MRPASLLLASLLLIPALRPAPARAEVDPSFPVHYEGGASSADDPLKVGYVTFVRDSGKLYAAAYFKLKNGKTALALGNATAGGTHFKVNVTGQGVSNRGTLTGDIDGDEWTGVLEIRGLGKGSVAGRVRVTDETATRLLPGVYDAKRRDESNREVIVTISLGARAKYSYVVKRRSATLFQLTGKWTPVVLGTSDGDRLFFGILPTGGSPSVVRYLPQLSRIGDYSLSEFSLQFLNHNGSLEWVTFKRRP